MTALILSLTVPVAAGVLSMEIWGWLPTLSRWFIWLATLSLPRERRMLRRKEFREELKGYYAERRVAGLAWTLKLTPVCVWERASAISPERWGRLVAWCLTLSFVVYISFSESQKPTIWIGAVIGGLVYLYLRHSRSFYFVRTTFLIVMVPGAAHSFAETLPIAHPFLVSEDFVQAALHMAFTMLIAAPLASLVRLRVTRAFWRAYPFGLPILALITSVSAWQPLMAPFVGVLLSAVAVYIARLIYRYQDDTASAPAREGTIR